MKFYQKNTNQSERASVFLQIQKQWEIKFEKDIHGPDSKKNNISTTTYVYIFPKLSKQYTRKKTFKKINFVSLRNPIHQVLVKKFNI